jgi:glycosyltransferase involved in cell wall biosynthesis
MEGRDSSRLEEPFTVRIAVVAPPLLPVPPRAYAGTERVVAALIDELARRGEEVTLFASGDSRPDVPLVATVPTSSWQHDGDPSAAMMLTAEVARRHAGEFDLIHSHLDVAGLPLMHQVPIPVVSTIHCNPGYGWTADALAAFDDAQLVAISEAQRATAPRAHWVATIPHGLPLASMPFGERPGDYLLVVGRMTAEKGIAEAMDLAQRSGIPLRIVAKLEHWTEKEYFAEAIEPRLGETEAEFLGELSPAERDPIFAGALATLMLGDWPEPFGLVAIESMATGTPVIARRGGALPEIVQHGVSGFVVDDLEDALRHVGECAQLDRVAIRSRTLHQFSAERMADDYLALFRRLVCGELAGMGTEVASEPVTTAARSHPSRPWSTRLARGADSPQPPAAGGG